MKKFLKLALIIMIASTFKIIDVKAVSSKMEPVKGKLYKYSWSEINDYNSSNYSYYINCKNVTFKNFSGLSSKKISASSGYVLLGATISNGEISCEIYKDDSGKPTLTSAKISIGTTQAPSTTQTPKTTTTQTLKSNNANIKSLTIKGNDDSDVVLSPVFNPGVYDYEATVASFVKTVSITPILEDAKANAVISNNANEELKAGEDNKITITVTAEDGSKKAYNINIKREALTSDATLKNLEIEEIEKFKFDKDKFTYNVKIGKNVKSLTITYELSDENSTVDIEGNSKLKNGSVVKVIVTAQDGTKKVYTLNIQKETNSKKKVANVAAEKNPLIILGLSMTAFALVGGIIYVAKK